MFKRLRQVVDQIGTLQTLYSLLKAPTVAAMLTAVSGYLGGIPTMWVVFATAGAFAFTAHGLLRASELTHRMRVDGKLDFVNPHFGIECEWNEEGKPVRVRKMNVGLQLVNRAHFPIVYNIKSITAVVNDRAANAAKLENRDATIVSNAMIVTHPDSIDLADLNTLDFKGRLDFELHYGRSNAAPHVIKKRLEIEVSVHPQNSIKPNPNVGIAVRDRD